ncbi:MAG: glycosyltransferase family 1 protein [Geobacter sp.]|nr:MAG: glycosyltransferase family 1 protein [Geobacter sp.]
MKIFMDNIVFQLQKAGGISVYWAELIKRLVTSDLNTTFIEQSVQSGNIFRNQLSLDKKQIMYEKGLPLRLLRYLPLQLKIEGMSVFHSSYYRVCNQKHVVNIVTVHDFIYEYFSSGLKRLVHSSQKKKALEFADGIICVSENTKTDLLKFYPWVDESRIKVIYNGVSADYFPVGSGSAEKSCFDNILTKKYMLYVGNRSVYKNFKSAVDVISQLNDYVLVIVGGNTLSSTEEHDLKSRLPHRYYHLKEPDNNELNLLYNNAHCLLYLSSYEGFGIPLVEAMKSGCPVVTTNAASIPEVIGNAGLIVDQNNVRDILEKIDSLDNVLFRNEVIESGYAQASKFSWDKCFDETIGFYEQASNRRDLNA